MVTTHPSSSAPVHAPPAAPRALAGVGRALLTFVTILAGLLAGLGWCYVLHRRGWLGAGPRVGGALPLLQLAKLDAQPLLRLAVAWLLAGLLTGLLLARRSRPRRVVLAAVLGTLLLWLNSQGSLALTRNVSVTTVVWGRAPGAATWIAAGLFTLACAVAPTRRPH